MARLAILMAGAVVLSGCAGSAPTIPAAEQPLSKETMMLLGKKGMDTASPIFIRIFKDDSELEVWKARDDGRFYHFKTYPICNWSGALGPKVHQGDHQAPEGFYTVAKTQMNPNSQFHVAFNTGYPNAYDRANGRTGDALMVHGKCRSAGCYAMTDALIEEIYALARESIKGGQDSFEVQALPFRMTAEAMAAHRQDHWYPFWVTLKQGYDHFETYRVPPAVAVCEKRYVVNVTLPTGVIDPAGLCPAFTQPQLTPFTPRAGEQVVADERIVLAGPKLHDVASTDAGQDGVVSGLGGARASPTVTGSINAASTGAPSPPPATGTGTGFLAQLTGWVSAAKAPAGVARPATGLGLAQ